MGTQSFEVGLGMPGLEMPRAKRYWTSTELQRAFRLTNRQLQYWHEEGIIVPDISSHQRRYTERQAIEVGMAKYLLQAFKRSGFDILARIRAMKGGSRYLLISSNGSIHWCDSQGYLIQDLMRQSEKGLRCLLIDRDKLRERLNA